MSSSIDLEKQLQQVMLADRHPLRRLLQSIERRHQRGQPAERESLELEQRLSASHAVWQQRHDQLPMPTFDNSLPIAAKREEIQQALEQHQVIVVCGETGSGKSTQLPKICLAAGRGVAGLIGHTQPRRLAARTIAARLADELGTSVGGQVGFKIRFTDTVRETTYVKLMTDGILLAETQQDKFLDRYDTLIIDEAHERSLNIDFLMGYVKRLLPRRPDLRLIITSATIDAERFAAHFGHTRPAPVIEVSGRSYPVETRYRPAEEEDDEQQSLLAAVDELCREGPGDVLVFLPTESEIRDAARRLRGWAQHRAQRPEILPLYARLSAAEQNRVFQPGKQRRIVLATNVAESSLTVPGIRYVVDTGTARLSRYSPRSKVQRLPIEPVSRASADQRQGRCGRVAPGICIRLYSEEDYLNREQYTTPEIRRTNLAAVILQMLALRLGAVDEFPFLDPPRADAIRDGYKTLYELGAIDQRRELTEMGRRMARLPVDPRIARMILAADQEGCLAEILIIASALEIQDPRERPPEKRQQADEAHGRFADASSDFLALLNMWDFVHRLKDELSRSQLRKACQQSFLHFVRLREWQDVHRQLKQLVQQLGLRVAKRRNQYDAIHRALLSGLLSNVAMLTDRHEYQAAGGAKAFLWPGSGLFGAKPKWVVAAEAVETSKRYLRTVARVEPQWIESLAPHLVKRSHADPYWSRKQGTVMAMEKVSLFGLPLVAGRRVRYGPIDPVKSRQLFIQSGLVEGDIRLDVGFYRHNQALIERLQSLGARSRQAGFLVPEGVQLAFYEERLPAETYDIATLRHFLRQPGADASLRMQEADLLPETGQSLPAADAFPDQVAAGGLQLPVQYIYQPGEERDGLSIEVPLAASGQLDPQQLEWLVPGLLEEKLVHLIRSLPKSIRRSLVPAPDSARKAAALLEFGKGPFLPAVAAALSQVAGEPIPVAEFDLQRLPQHLRVHVRVLDDGGQVVAEGRDLDQLRRELPRAPQSEEGTIEDDAFHRDGLTTWDFGRLPEEHSVRRGQMTFKAYPALLDRGDSVSLRLLDDPGAAEHASRGGVRRLVCLGEHRELKSQVNWLPDLPKMEMVASTLRQSRDLRSQLIELLADLAYIEDRPLPRDEEAFQQLVKQGRRRLPIVVQDVAQTIAALYDHYHQVRLRLDELRAPQAAESLADARQQLDALMREGFLVDTPWRWLQHYPRYLRALGVRLEKLASGGSARDAELRRMIQPHWQAYLERRKAHEQQGKTDPELVQFRWLLEEWRVSLFAQQLGTAEKVSPQRIEKQWAKVSA